MRACQICDQTGKRVILSDYDGNLALFECTSCGHRYVDGLVTQAWFDDYYLTQYTTDDKPYSDARLNSLADCVASYITKKISNVADIGGADGELAARLRERNVIAWAYGVGEEQNKQWKADAVILSHTLEHIYDVGAMFERIDRFMPKGGLLFVETPIHLYDNYQEPTKYDYHWQHINKFRPRDIEALFIKHGFKVEVSEQLPDYREYNCWRIVGRK